jgi:serine/threonine protein kinase
VSLKTKQENPPGAPRSNLRKTTIAKPVPDEFEIDRSEIQTGDRIGIGGTAEVFRGTYRGTEVAIKRMHFDGKSMPAHVEAFRKEIFAMATCRHPNLVLLMGAVTRVLPLTLVTELCRGGSLYDLLYTRKFKLCRKQQIKISLDVARAVKYLHSQKPILIHRDLKSLNTLLLEPVSLLSDIPVGKLADFGAAKQMQESTMTANTGTYVWMAPEVLNGVSYSEKVDVYSFAMLMYEIFSGYIPFTEHEYLEPLQIAQAVQRGLRPGIEKVSDFRAREIIEKCWRKDPSTRPDMAEVIDAILAL